MSGFEFVDAVGFAPPVDNPVLLYNNQGEILQAFDLIESPVIDVRAFQSIILIIEFDDGTAISLTDSWVCDVDYYANADGTDLVFNDSFSLWGQEGNINVRPLRITDTVHGPYIQLSFYEGTGNGRTTGVYCRLYGSYRPLPNVFVRGAGDGFVYDDRIIVGAGLTNTSAVYFGYGPAKLSMLTGAAGGATAIITYGSMWTTERLVIAAANTYAEKRIVMPKLQAKIAVTNNGGAASDIAVSIILESHAL